MRIAITGGIGSGKTFVCKSLAHYGIKVYDCDAAAKWLMRSSPSLRQALMALVGEDVYEGNELQKQVLAKFLLASDANKQRVNDVVHPAVARDFEQSGYEWLESAILFDSGFDRRIHFDAVVCVTAPLDVRIHRVMQRDGISREKTLEWINCQSPQEEVLRRSDYEIINDGNHDIDIQIKNLINNIQKTLHKMETILSIAGKPGLFRMLSRGKQNLIVETLDENKKRMPTFANDRVISLADISMYTDSEDIPLWKVLKSLGEKEGSKPCSLNYKKASGKELREFFAEVLPDYDRERVHDSDIRKLIQWYDILVNNGITDFEATLAPTEGENVDDRKDDAEAE
ncbi:MAG: dephospho-CoA kinase [Prevotella sp.]|nr:dephospho-CoA kinase [Prevotella sp.]